MRILLVNDYGTASGGAERQMISLRAGLKARGHDVRLLTSDALLVPGWPMAADATCRGTLGRAQPYLQTWNPWAAAALARELRDFRPDVVHLRMFLWQMSPSLLPLLADVPTLHQMAVYKAICPTGLKILPDGRECLVDAGRACLDNGCVALPTFGSTMLQLALVRRYRRHIDRVVALSSDMARVLARHGLDDVLVIENGVDERPVRPALTGPPVLAYAGRLAREKGVDVLISAFAAVLPRIPDAQLWIAGSGPLEAELRAQAAPLRQSVQFLGYMQRAEMEQKFDSAWAQAMPSLWREPFGNVATEAMMRGTAVIASNAGGFADSVIDGETGILCPAGDSQALEIAILRLLGDRVESERIGALARRHALSNYAQSAVVEKFESLYSLMQRSKSL